MVRCAGVWYFPSYDESRHFILMRVKTKACTKHGLIRIFAKRFSELYLSTPKERKYMLDLGLDWIEYPFGLTCTSAEDDEYFKRYVFKYAK